MPYQMHRQKAAQRPAEEREHEEHGLTYPPAAVLGLPLIVGEHAERNRAHGEHVYADGGASDARSSGANRASTSSLTTP